MGMTALMIWPKKVTRRTNDTSEQTKSHIHITLITNPYIHPDIEYLLAFLLSYIAIQICTHSKVFFFSSLAFQ